ncbi:hypothetical protein EC988_002997 [Linderina pennispora]|nr:hypothetical protein EC988_002997 [Linderina pennispora]
MRTGAHTPFGNPGWRAAASAFLDGQKPQPAVSYVLPKDLNEARDPNVVASVIASAVNTGDARNTPEPAEALDSLVNPSKQDDDSAVEVEDAPMTPAPADDSQKPKPRSSASPGHFNSHLPNSSFYKPLSSICTPLSRTASSSNVSQPMSDRPKSECIPPASAKTAERSEPSAAAPMPASSAAAVAAATATVADFCSGAPLVSLAEVNAALTALAEQVSTSPSVVAPAVMTTNSTGGVSLKRKMSSSVEPSDMGQADSVLENKRRRSSTEPTTGASADQPITDPSTPIDLSMLFGTGSASAAASLGPGTPMTQMMNARDSPMGVVAQTRKSYQSEEDDWLATMDQLVDTDALLIESPPPSPADGASSDATDISQQLSSSLASRKSAADPLARWDRIPVNIFRRSRALASTHGRHAMMGADSSPTSMSSLALSAIKSNRQRRALVNTTLLAQHTLPSEALLHRQKMKGVRRAAGFGAMPPPPPPPTPRGTVVDVANPAGTLASLLLKSGASQQPDASVSVDSLTRNHSAPGLNANTATRAADAVQKGTGTPWELSSQVSDNSVATANSADAATGGKQRRRGSTRSTRAGSASSGSDYVFGWLEDEDDLALFAMPELTPGGDPTPRAMVLASASPMMMPFKSPTSSGNDVNGGSDPHFAL